MQAHLSHPTTYGLEKVMENHSPNSMNTAMEQIQRLEMHLHAQFQQLCSM